MISYRYSSEGITTSQVQGFFEGWPHPPSPETHLQLLAKSDEVVLAFDDDTVVGFITAITDYTLSAYIPLLEVLPSYRGRGIGRELVSRMLSRLDGMYMIDLLCDERMQSFYATLGMRPATGVMIRNSYRQSGLPSYSPTV